MMQPIQSQHQVEEPVFPIEELPSALIENILDRMDWKSLCECSKSCKWIRQFVWLNPRYMPKILNDKLMTVALKCIEMNGLSNVELACCRYRIFTAWVDTNSDTVFGYLDSIQHPIYNVELRLDIVPHLSPIQAVQQLLIANEIVEKWNGMSSYRVKIVKSLSRVDLPQAIRVSGQIKDPLKLVNALLYIAEQQSSEDRKETLTESIEVAKSIEDSLLIRCVLNRWALLLSPSRFHDVFNLYVKDKIGDFLAQSHGYDMIPIISKVAPFETEWAISTALSFDKREVVISALCGISLELYPRSPEKANRVIKIALEKAVAYVEYMRVSIALSKWDKVKSEEVFKKALYVFEEFSEEDIFSREFCEICEIFPDISYDYVRFIKNLADRALIRTYIGIAKQDKEIYSQGFAGLMQPPNRGIPSRPLDMSKILSFGKKFAVEMVRRFKHPEYRAEKLFQLARLVIKKDPQLAIDLVKEGMELTRDVKSPQSKIDCYTAFQRHTD